MFMIHACNLIIGFQSNVIGAWTKSIWEISSNIGIYHLGSLFEALKLWFRKFLGMML